MINTQFFLGYNKDFKGICYIYPPKVKDVVSNQNYNIYARMLTLSQEEIEDEYVKHNLDMTNLLTPMEYLLNNSYNNKDFAQLAHGAFMFFIHEPVTFLYEEKKILIGEIKDLQSLQSRRILSEDEYFEFQNEIRRATGAKAIEPYNSDENPRIKQMKAKARYRDKIKAEKGVGLQLISSLASICCMNMGLNPLNIGELSYPTVQVLIATYQEKEKYDIDIRSILAGADSKKVKPKYWIRNLDEK